jgi:hypothetical protein
MNTEEIALVNALIYDAETRDNTLKVLGTIKTMFPDWTSFFVKLSKTDATRCTILLKKEKKMVNVTMSPRLSKLFRENKISEDQVVGLEVYYIDKNEKGVAITPRLSVGLPSAGWIEVSKIVVKAFNLSDYHSVAGV